jgi:mRNA interferase RelE/StbE
VTEEFYRVAWTPPAQRDMTRLPPKIADAIITYVDSRLSPDPYRRSKPLSGEFEGLRSARNGDYRVLFEIDEPAKRLDIIRVHHRAHAYRPR